MEKLPVKRYVVIKSPDHFNKDNYHYVLVDTQDFFDFNPNTGEATEYYRVGNNLVWEASVLTDWSDGGSYEIQSDVSGEILYEFDNMARFNEFFSEMASKFLTYK